MGKGSGTRSGLLWEVERLLKESKELPQVLLMENVPQVIGKKNIGAFAEWIAFLDSLGYHSKWEVINATEYAVPQNRRRCFMVSVLGDHFYNFPKKIGNTRRLRDLLEENVPEYYYLSEKILQYFIKHSKECEEKGQGFKFAPSNGASIARTVSTRAGNRMDDNFVAFYGIDYNQTGEEWIRTPLKEKARCIRTTGGGAVIEQTKRCICIGMLGGKYETLHDQTRRVYDIDGCAPTQHTVGGGNLETKITDSDYRVRKLTERECFRLMGVKDEDFDKISPNQSKSKLYHLAGDSIVTTCLMALFGQMLDVDMEEKIREVTK